MTVYTSSALDVAAAACSQPAAQHHAKADDRRISNVDLRHASLWLVCQRLLLPQQHVNEHC